MPSLVFPDITQVRLRGLACAACAALLMNLAGCALLRQPEAPPALPAPPAAPSPLPTNRFILEPGSNIVGQLQVIRARQKDTFIDIAQAYHLGYDELVEANPKVDPWLPGEGREIVLPTRFVLPDVPHQGIVLNVPAKRLYYFPRPAAGEQPSVLTFPVSIGREGWATPLGVTRVASKVKDPVWHVPASVRKEHAGNGDPLPAEVPPGPDNPLGRYAMRLAISGDYLIHGTNKPAGVGMRISHGCIRMNPDDIEWLYPQVPVGLPVRILNQPATIGWRDGDVFLSVHQPLEEDKPPKVDPLRRQLTDRTRRAAKAGATVDPDRVRQLVSAARGIPVSVLAGGPDAEALVKAAPRVQNIVTYEWFADGPQPAAAGSKSP